MQEIILDINISTAIYAEVYFRKHQKYPKIFYQEKSHLYHPIIVSEEIHDFLCHLFSGIEIFFQRYKIDISGKVLGYRKYILLDGIRDFFISYLREKTEIFLYETFSFHHQDDTVTDITFKKNDIEKQYDDVIMISGGNKFFTVPISSIDSYKKVELFTVPTSRFTGLPEKIYESTDEGNHTLIFSFLAEDRAYIGIEYLPGRREEATESSMSFFAQYIRDFILQDIEEGMGRPIDISVSLAKPEFKNVRLIGTGLGYLPIMYNFGLLFSILDAVYSVYDSYYNVIYHRANLYKVFRSTFEKHGTVEKDILIDDFFNENKRLHISSMSKFLDFN